MSHVSARTYKSVQWAVLPGTAARSGLIGLLYIPVVFGVVASLRDWSEGTDFGPTVESVISTLGWGGITAIGFSTPVVVTVLLAYLGYRRRRYELGEDGITERRGILFARERHVPYDDIGDVSFSQSWSQSLYNTGTVEIADVGARGDEQQPLELMYVRDPEAVYTNVLRTIADATGSIGSELDPPTIGEVPSDAEDISGLSGDRLAAGTGFRYMMPRAILRPSPWEAAKYGGLRSLYHSAIGAALLYYSGGTFVGLTNVPSVTFFRGVILLGAVGYACVLGAWYYVYHDNEHYELYEDHVRVIHGDKTSSIAFDDVATFEVREGLISNNDVDNIALIAKNGDDLAEFRFMTEPNEVRNALEEWIEAARAAREKRTGSRDRAAEDEDDAGVETDVDEGGGLLDPTGSGILG